MNTVEVLYKLKRCALRQCVICEHKSPAGEAACRERIAEYSRILKEKLANKDD